MDFVESSVLESTDGVSFQKERKLEQKEEIMHVRKRDTGGLSLSEQLAINKEEKEAEYKSKHNMFAPPPGLDQEEFDFFAQKEKEATQKRSARAQQAIDDSEAYEEALLASRNAVKKVEERSEAESAKFSFVRDIISSSVAENTNPVKSVVTVKVKKHKADKDKKKKDDKKRKRDDDADDTTTGSKKGGNAVLGLGLAYGSDSDE